ncbi:MAG: uroporphyrinogen decarboxylase [Rhodospirillales bacterium]
MKSGNILPSPSARGSTHAKPLLRALAGQTAMPPPIWLMRQAGRYLPEYRAARTRAKTFLDLCFSPELAAEITLQPIRRFGFDAAILFSDILVVPHALGRRVGFVEGEGPKLDPIRADEIAALNVRSARSVLAPVFETIRAVRAALPERVALIGFAGAPWTVASYMVEGGSSRDFAGVKRFALGDATNFQLLIDRLVEATADYLIAQAEAGAEALQLFDSWAGVLSEGELRRWAIAPTRAIVGRVKAAHPGVPIIGFPRGAGVMYADYARETGVDALSLDAGVPLGLALALQARMPVQGNLDPQLVVVGGEAMRRGAREVVGALGGGPFVFNLGHGIVPETPPEHVAELVRIVREERAA